MRIKKLIKIFNNNSVSVCGMKGKGKDVLFGNVIARQNCPFVSNVNYTNDDNFHYLDLKKIDIDNDYINFLSDNLNYYEYKYPKASDIFISDVGVYFPSQYFSELNKNYKSIPLYVALSRQISNNHIHFNVQNLNRCWDKLREMSDIYILCNFCKFVGNVVFMSVTIYDKYESALNRVKPFSVPKIKRDKSAKAMIEIARNNYFNTYGSVKKRLLIFKNMSKHKTLAFGERLKNGKKKENSIKV